MVAKGPCSQTGILSFSEFPNVHFNLTSHGFNITLCKETSYKTLLFISRQKIEKQRVTKVKCFNP